MGATTDDVFAAATTEAAAQVADAKEPEPKSADSAPAVTDADEENDGVLTPVQKRINELTREKHDAKRRADQIAADRDEWRDRALRVEKPAQIVEESTPTAGKKLADFGYDEEKYQDYLFKQAEDRAAKAAESVLTRQQNETQRVQMIVAHKARESEFAKKVPDYFEIAHYAPITQTLAELVMESDQSAALAYHLGKNPEVATRLSQLPERMQARELGRIEAKLLDAPKPPQVSGAPPPAPKIAPSNAQVEKDPKDWTDTDFAKWRKKHM